MPAAKVTACCSAMPTSKLRLGNFLANASSPVPDGIAALIATMRLIGLGLGDQRVGEDLGVARRAGRGLHLLAGDDVELDHAVVLVGAGLGRGVALALLGHHMQQDRAVQFGVAQVAQHRQQMLQVVPVDRADIVEAQFLEQRPAGQQAAGVFVGPLGGALDRRREAPRQLRHHLAQRQEGAGGDDLRQVGAHRADRRRDRHVVVVEDDDQPGLVGAGIVHGLIGHARAHRAVADDGDDVARIALQVARHRHAEAGRRSRCWNAPRRRGRIRSRDAG